MGLDYSPGERIVEPAQVTVADGPAFGDGGAGWFRFNFATPHLLMAEMIERIAGVVNDGSLGG
jgi:cysteine-S-conjugate beta-lyase